MIIYQNSLNEFQISKNYFFTIFSIGKGRTYWTAKRTVELCEIFPYRVLQLCKIFECKCLSLNTKASEVRQQKGYVSNHLHLFRKLGEWTIDEEEYQVHQDVRQSWRRTMQESLLRLCKKWSNLQGMYLVTSNIFLFFSVNFH